MTPSSTLTQHESPPNCGLSEGSTQAGAQRSQTTVKVREVGLFVEKLVANARREHQAGLVTLAPGKSADDLDLFGGLYS